ESETNQQVSNTQFATDINQLRTDLAKEAQTRESEDDKLDLKIRQNIINIGTNLGSINALDARVLRLEQGGGGGGGTLTPEQLANIAQLNKENVFTKENTFNMGVQIPTAPKDDDSATNKAYVTNQLNAQLQLVNEILKDYVKTSEVKEVDYYSQLPNNATAGEVYKVVIGDLNYKAGYYLYTGAGWQFVGGSMQEIESAGFAMLRQANTFTKVNVFQEDVLLEGGNPKTQDSAVNKRYLESQLNNHTQGADLKYAQKAQPNNFTALNTFAVTPQINGTITNNNDATSKQYVDNAIVNAINGQVPIDLSAYAQVKQLNNWTAQQNFLSEVLLQNGQPTSLESAVNRGWVETYVTNELANNVPNIDTSDLAKLSQDNTFTGVNHFTLTNTNTFDLMSNNGKTLLSANNVNMQVDMPLLAKNPKTEAEKDQIADNEFVTKAQVAFLAGSGGGGNSNIVSTEVANGDYPVGTLWIKTSFTQDNTNPNIFTDIPAIYISLGNSQWWDLHGEALL
uniref:Autotransporter domain-containing protein n=1 Tax=Syphacia muris TaxID=451379 RepID=A0A0N5ACM7_9BILA